jgi:hypothetical protein
MPALPRCEFTDGSFILDTSSWSFHFMSARTHPQQESQQGRRISGRNNIVEYKKFILFEAFQRTWKSYNLGRGDARILEKVTRYLVVSQETAPKEIKYSGWHIDLFFKSK